MKDEEIVTLEELDTKELVNDEDQKNAKALACLRCNCKILPVNTGTYVNDAELEQELHVMHKKQEEAGIKKEKIKQFFLVNDMYDFDNIGFTKPVTSESTVKYLICADCEVGPLGWHCISSKKNYVALARVKHI